MQILIYIRYSALTSINIFVKRKCVIYESNHNFSPKVKKIKRTGIPSILFMHIMYIFLLSLRYGVIPLLKWIHQQERKRRDAADRIGSFQAPFDIVRELHYIRRRRRRRKKKHNREYGSCMKAQWQTFQHIHIRIEIYSFGFQRYLTSYYIYIQTVWAYKSNMHNHLYIRTSRGDVQKDEFRNYIQNGSFDNMKEEKKMVKLTKEYIESI